MAERLTRTTSPGAPMRFSTVAGDPGAIGAEADMRGFALKATQKSQNTIGEDHGRKD